MATTSNQGTGKFQPHPKGQAVLRQKQIVWVQLTDYKYPQTALYLPEKYHKEAISKAHDSIFGGHYTT